MRSIKVILLHFLCLCATDVCAGNFDIFKPFVGTEAEFLKEQREKQMCLDHSVLTYPDGKVALILYAGGSGEISVALGLFICPKNANQWELIHYWNQGWPFVYLPRQATEEITIKRKNGDIAFSIKASSLFDFTGGFERQDCEKHIKDQMRLKAEEHKK
jgi:hypothetical protein